MRRALITGITGQDGSYLAEFLLGKGYEVYGAFRRLSTPNFWRLQSLGIYEKVKLYAYWITRVYREGYGLFACNGILFNHESPLRGLEFVSRRVSNATARISLGLQDSLSIGNLKARRDWGFARDYIESMWKMLQQKSPSDYVIATGEAHTVQELVDIAFSHQGLDPDKHLKVEQRLMRPLDVDSLRGDSTKARADLSCKPSVT